MIEGLSHVTFVVRDLDRMSERPDIGGRAMTSAVSATVTGVPAAIVGVSAMSLVATAAVPTFGIAGTFPWRRKNPAPQKKDDDAGERQQHDPEVNPSGRIHVDPVRFPRLAGQFGSTQRM